MRIFYLNALIFVKEGCAEGDDDINEEAKVDTSIDGWDRVAS